MLLFPYSWTLHEAENHNEMVSVSLRNRSIMDVRGQSILVFHDGCPSTLFSWVFMDECAFSKLEMVQEAAQKIRRYYRNTYRYGAGAKTICKYKHTSFEYVHTKQLSFCSSDLAPGGSDDWIYDLGVKYSFTFELQDRGRYGFLLPPSHIVQACNEALTALKTIARRVIEKMETPTNSPATA